MTRNKAHALSAVFALALAALLAGQAHATCSGSQSISYQSAECLRAKISTVASGQTVEIQNLCPDYGDVTAKIDKEILADVIVYLKSGTMVEQSATQVNGVYCCKDLGDLCDKSDVIDDDSCFEQFEGSSADDSCKDETATATSNDKCAISATCKDINGSYGQYQSTATVSWPDAARLHNCNKKLRVGGCPWD